MVYQLFVLLASCLMLSAIATDYTKEALADQIVNLPGSESLNINFNQFSGYLTVNGTKNMHYWMVESMNNPATDPVAFWSNGGPGCSGLLGFLTEQGPFRANKDLTLSANPYAWNKIANMVFIEAPCGVGFSYSDNKDDYKTNDAQTAIDNYNFIQAFFVRFPHLAKNDLYITSESYGGHYMPTLADQILTQNTLGQQPHLNFKGFAVGNPATTFYSAIPAGLDAYWGHQIVSKPLWDKFTSECRDKLIPNITDCEMIFEYMYVQVSRNLNPYALDYPVCTEDSPRKFGRNQRNWLFRHLTADAPQSLKDAMGLEPDASYEPCAVDYMTSYLNLASVKTAIHVKGDIDWADCSRTIHYDQKDGSKSMVPYYQKILANYPDVKVLVYSGDDDSVCATIGTQSWIWDLGYSPSHVNWAPYVVSGQTAGFLTKWEGANIGFLTVHGAGHEVPAYKPEVAFHLFSDYLAGKLTGV